MKQFFLSMANIFFWFISAIVYMIAVIIMPSTGVKVICSILTVIAIMMFGITVYKELEK